MGTLTQGMFLASEASHTGPLPSFFEVFMQDRINQSLKPALKHVAMVLMERYPQAVVLLENFDELFAILSFTVERQYLHRTDSLFAESLYGFKRSREESGQLVDLTDRDRRRALLVSVLIPYLKAKLDGLYARWQADRASGGSGWRGRLRSLLVGLYPSLHAGYEGVFFVYQWAYLLGFKRYYSPLLHLSNTVLRRLTQQDLEKQRQLDVATAESRPGALTYLKLAFLLAILGFKAVEWLHHSAPALAPPRPSGVVPPVPDKPAAAVGGLPLPLDPAVCPLCSHTRVNPAVSPSGVAFCYRCLVTHVRDYGNCPVTLQGCREEQIRRLYLS